MLSISSAACVETANSWPLDLQAHLEQIRAIAQHEGFSQTCLERIEKAERVVPKMQATIEFVSGYVGQQINQLDLQQPASFAMHAKLIPSFYLDRVAQTRTVSDGQPLRELAARFAPRCLSLVAS